MKTKTQRKFLLQIARFTILFGVIPVLQAAAELPTTFTTQWPSLRGPGGYGVAHPKNTMTKWDVTSGEGIQWSTEVPLPGFNSPVVWNDHVFLSGANETQARIFCFNALTGESRWDYTVISTQSWPTVSADAGLSAPTMATDGTHVFAIFANGELVALDFKGNLIWQKSLPVPDNPYGMGSSLICDTERLFVQYDHMDEQYVMALNGATGAPVWKQERSHISWSSPALIPSPSGLQLLLNDEEHVTAYDPATGKELWHVACLGGEVAPSPAFNGKDLVFAGNEYAQLSAIKLNGAQPTILWQYEDILPEISSPLAAAGLLFIPSSYGDVVCLDEKTGATVWEHSFDADVKSSPVLVGDRIYLIDCEGVMHIFRAARFYEEIATIEMGEPAYATPAFTQGRIYIRGEKTCTAFENAPLAKINLDEKVQLRRPKQKPNQNLRRTNHGRLNRVMMSWLVKCHGCLGIYTKPSKVP